MAERSDTSNTDTVQKSQGIPPRLLNIAEAGDYLGVSYMTMRDWVIMGVVPVVALPARIADGGRNGKERRNVLIDREDLDRLIEERKYRKGSGVEVATRVATKNPVAKAKKGKVPEKGWHEKY